MRIEVPIAVIERNHDMLVAPPALTNKVQSRRKVDRPISIFAQELHVLGKDRRRRVRIEVGMASRAALFRDAMVHQNRHAGSAMAIQHLHEWVEQESRGDAVNTGSQHFGSTGLG